MQTIAQLRARSAELVRRLEDGDDRCWRHDPEFGNGPPKWTNAWIALLEELEVTEDAIAWQLAHPAAVQPALSGQEVGR